ncbi:hypothetical protein QE152_g29117 [Popillia japonica]|uniref:Uncharacterized protein n=1 Tax=Popillia japonica TaxID=7064 RepID=A0AAW1JKC4_POPJA
MQDSDDEVEDNLEKDFNEMQDSDDEVEDNLEKDFSPSESEYEPGTSDVESTDSEQSYTGQRKRKAPILSRVIPDSEKDGRLFPCPSCKNLNRQKTI